MTFSNDSCSSSCSQSQLLSAYLDGELTASQRRAIETHLGACEACTAELQALAAASEWFSRQSPMLQLNGQMIDDRNALLGRWRVAIARQWEQYSPAMSAPQLLERGWMLRVSRRLAAMAACLAVAGTLWLWRSDALRPSQPMAIVSPIVPAPWETPAILPQLEAQPASSELVSNVSNDLWLSEWIVDDLSRGPR